LTTFTIILPTHDHPDTLPYAVTAVQVQTRQDFELFIVGDGVSDSTRTVIRELTAKDARIRFFDLPKGPRNGEINRRPALAEANCRLVCYAADDDLWFPDHLETMGSLLDKHDIAHTITMFANRDGSVSAAYFDAACPADRARVVYGSDGFSLANTGHTLEAYRHLPVGWRTTPAGIATDVYMWLQFLEQPWCRYASHPWPTVVHFVSPLRRDMPPAERGAEIAAWAPRFADAETRAKLIRDALQPVLATRQMRAARVDVLSAALALVDGVAENIAGWPALDATLFGNAVAAVYRTAEGAPGCSCLLYGFSTPEDWGCWADGFHAALAVPLPPTAEEGDAVELDCIFFVHPSQQKECRFTLRIDNAPPCSFTERAYERVVRVPLPERIPNAPPLAIMRFTIETARSPQELGLSADPRRLCIGLRSLRVVRRSPLPSRPA